MNFVLHFHCQIGALTVSAILQLFRACSRAHNHAYVSLCLIWVLHQAPMIYTYFIRLCLWQIDGSWIYSQLIHNVVVTLPQCSNQSNQIQYWHNVVEQRYNTFATMFWQCCHNIVKLHKFTMLPCHWDNVRKIILYPNIAPTLAHYISFNIVTMLLHYWGKCYITMSPQCSDNVVAIT